MANSYEQRLIRVIEHIHDNVDGDLSLDTLADLAALSRFHFHRVWTAMTGEPLAQTIRRVRLHKAALALVRHDASLSEVAAQSGYRDQSSFTRAFREAFGITPGAYRRRGRAIPVAWANKLETRDMHEVEIRTIEPRRLAAIEHRGAYSDIGVAFEKASATIAGRGAIGETRGMAGLYFDDARSKPADALRSFGGFVVTDGFAITPPLEEHAIAGGRFAVLRFTGPYTGLQAAYDWLFGPWLAQSNETLREAPAVEFYLNTPMDATPEDLLTEIQMPLEG